MSEKANLKGKIVGFGEKEILAVVETDLHQCFFKEQISKSFRNISETL